MADRMFRVLVLGGMALVGCGDSVAPASDGGIDNQRLADATPGDISFPTETNAALPDAHSSDPASPDGGQPGIQALDAEADDVMSSSDAATTPPAADAIGLDGYADAATDGSRQLPLIVGPQ